jgi:hypothetical protein
LCVTKHDATVIGDRDGIALLYENCVGRLETVKKLIHHSQVPLTTPKILTLLFPEAQGSTLLTSGLSTSQNCEFWCPTGEQIVPTIVKNYMIPAPNTSSSKCVALNSGAADNSSICTHVPCQSQNIPFVCEQDCKQPLCPKSCTKNVCASTEISYLNANIFSLEEFLVWWARKPFGWIHYDFKLKWFNFNETEVIIQRYLHFPQIRTNMEFGFNNAMKTTSLETDWFFMNTNNLLKIIIIKKISGNVGTEQGILLQSRHVASLFHQCWRAKMS